MGTKRITAEDLDIAAVDRALNARQGQVNPSVPDWMQQIIHGEWEAFHYPSPVVAEVLDSRHNWFAEADLNRPDFFLAVDEPMGAWAPSLTQLRSAWEHASNKHHVSFVGIQIAPNNESGPGHVSGHIQAFYVAVGQEHLPQARTELEELLGPSAKSRIMTSAWRRLADWDNSKFELLSWEWLMQDLQGPNIVSAGGLK